MLDKQTLKTLHHKDQFEDGPEKEYWILCWVFGRAIGEGLPAGSRVWDWSLVLGVCACVCLCVGLSFLAKTNRLALQSVLRSATNSLRWGWSLAPEGVSLTESLSCHRSLSHKVPVGATTQKGAVVPLCNFFWQLNKSNCSAIDNRSWTFQANTM